MLAGGRMVAPRAIAYRAATIRRHRLTAKMLHIAIFFIKYSVRLRQKTSNWRKIAITKNLKKVYRHYCENLKKVIHFLCHDE